MIGTLVLETFTPHVNEAFTVDLPSGESYVLTLTQVVAIAGANHTMVNRPPFDLRFHGPVAGHLPQQIHRLSHPVLGLLDIFLVPIGRDADAFFYQAVFH